MNKTGILVSSLWFLTAVMTGAAEAERAAAVPASPPPAVVAGKPLPLTVGEAILTALQHNRALSVDRMTPEIKRTFEQQERAQFDPVLSAQASAAQTRREEIVGGASPATRNISRQAQVGVSELLPTGTRIDLTGSTGVTDNVPGAENQVTTRLGLTVTQPLFQGAGLDVNLAGLRQARLDSLYSEYELRGLVQTLVADTETTYWDLYLARRQVEITRDSLALANQQLQETRERIQIGKLAGSELAAAEAEAALRQGDLIDAENYVAVTRLNLLRLLNPDGDGSWDLELELLDQPGLTAIPINDLGSHLLLARQMRPELNQARLQYQRNELELVKTRNGLLPRLDLFVSLGKSGYATTFGAAGRNLNGPNYDVQAGVTFAFPIGNRDARARQSRAEYTREQSRLALANLRQLAELDVRSRYLELQRAAEQIRITAFTRRAQEEKLRNENEKYRVGKSTALAVGQAQRDLLASQLAEVAAVVARRQADIELYRQDGSLLQRHSIACSGSTPIAEPL